MVGPSQDTILCGRGLIPSKGVGGGGGGGENLKICFDCGWRSRDTILCGRGGLIPRREGGEIFKILRSFILFQLCTDIT